MKTDAGAEGNPKVAAASCSALRAAVAPSACHREHNTNSGELTPPAPPIANTLAKTLSLHFNNTAHATMEPKSCVAGLIQNSSAMSVTQNIHSCTQHHKRSQLSHLKHQQTPAQIRVGSPCVSTNNNNNNTGGSKGWSVRPVTNTVVTGGHTVIIHKNLSSQRPR